MSRRIERSLAHQVAGVAVLLGSPAIKRSRWKTKLLMLAVAHEAYLVKQVYGTEGGTR